MRRGRLLDRGSGRAGLKRRLVRFLLMCVIACIMHYIVSRFGWTAAWAAFAVSCLGYAVGSLDK